MIQHLMTAINLSLGEMYEEKNLSNTATNYKEIAVKFIGIVINEQPEKNKKLYQIEKQREQLNYDIKRLKLTPSHSPG